MSMTVNNEEELSQAIMNDESEIIIPTPLGPVVIKLKNMGKAKWLVVIGSIGIAVVALYLMIPATATGPAAPPIHGLLAGTIVTTASGAIAIIGVGATIIAIKLCYFSGTKDTKVLKKLRNNYDLVNKDGVIKLVRK